MLIIVIIIYVSNAPIIYIENGKLICIEIQLTGSYKSGTLLTLFRMGVGKKTPPTGFSP